MGLAVTAALQPSLAGPKIADPAEVDADFALQGEYTGTVGEAGDQQKLARLSYLAQPLLITKNITTVYEDPLVTLNSSRFPH
jgi:hypothetical protein